jgi:hypothetical protein
MEVFRTNLSDQFSTDRGFCQWTSCGEVVEFDGKQFVKTGAVMIEGVAGWYATREQAEAAAADQIDTRVGILLAQALRLRRGTP